MAGIKVSRPGDWIFNEFPRKPTKRQLEHWFNVFWRVALLWIPPRDERFEYLRDMGAAQIDAVLNNLPLNMSATTESGGQHIMFIFPERHMTTQEESVFADSLARHHQIIHAKMTVIEIATKSALILTNFLSDDVRVIKDTGDFQTGLSNAHRQAVFEERHRRKG